jgi:DNA adenine methylase
VASSDWNYSRYNRNTAFSNYEEQSDVAISKNFLREMIILANIIKMPFKYMGGKSRLASWIISQFPRHKIYVEPFAGAAHVICRKEPSELDVYNDINDDMINLFKVLQDKKKTDKLLKLLSLTPHSRRMFNQIRDNQYLPRAETCIQEAYRTMIVMKQGFSGDHINRLPSWGYDKKRAQTCRAFELLPESITKILYRLKQMQIESLDFRKCIEKYDSPDTLFYCDPPYYGKEHYYSGNFKHQDHIDLANILNRIRGKACVSYYHFVNLRELYPYPEWEILEKKVTKYASSIKPEQQRPKTIEILLMNYKNV